MIWHVARVGVSGFLQSDCSAIDIPISHLEHLTRMLGIADDKHDERPTGAIPV